MKATNLAACAGAVMISGAARAQVYSWAAPVSGDWSVAANWSPAVVPHGTGVEVRLGLAGPYTVSFGGVGYAVGRYSASNPEAVLRLDTPAGDGADPTVLWVYGHLENRGLIRLAGDPTLDGDVRMQMNGGGSSLTGSGELRMEEAADTEFSLLGSGSFLHAAGHSITGEGAIRGVVMMFINEGLVSADRPGGLTIDTRAQNHATMRAIGAGRLILANDRITQTGAGVIEADGATVVFSPGEVWGGTVRAVNGGVIEVAPGSGAEVSEVTLEGTCVIEPSLTEPFTTLNIRYGMTNNGLIRVSGRSSTANNTRVQILDPGVIGGMGEIRLEEAWDTELFLDDEGGIAVNGAGHTISGVGRIHGAGMTLSNAGTLSPGYPLGRLFLSAPTTLEPTSLVLIELGGDDASQRDLLDATGRAVALGGTLRVTLRDGYEFPACGEAVVIRGDLSGRFAAHDLPVLAQGAMHVIYRPGEVAVGYLPGDLNGDGLLDFVDYLEFLSLYDGGDARADFNGDGRVDFSDYLEFLNLYEASC